MEKDTRAVEEAVAANAATFKDVCDLVKRAVNAKLEEAAMIADRAAAREQEAIDDADDGEVRVKWTCENIAAAIRKLKV